MLRHGRSGQDNIADMTDPLSELVINGRFLMQPTTGVQRVARELTRALDHMAATGALSCSLRLVCERDADISDLGLRATRVDRVGGRISGHLWEQFVLPRHVRGGFLLCLGNTAPLASLLGGKVAIMIHDLSYRLFPDAYRLAYRIGHTMMLPFLLRRSRLIFTVSETEKAMLSSLVPTARNRIVVAQNGGWRLGHDGMDDPGADAGSYLLYVGSLSKRKNIEGVVATAIHLARERAMPTILVGSVRHYLAHLPFEVPADVRHLIRWEGQVEDLDRLAQLYRGAACLLFPSFYEASPLPPLEAMHFGCPVVASDIPSMRERCGAAAAYCDAHDLQSIIAVTGRVIDDRDHAADLVAKGRIQATRFSWQQQAALVAEAIAQIF